MSKKNFKSGADNASVIDGNNLVDGLVDADAINEAKEDATSDVDMPVNSNYSNREWLEKNEPEFIPEFVSKKYDAEREPKVQAGLISVKELLPADKIHPLILLLAKWWEVKPARAEIKKMIDAEAAKNNTPEDVYLQKVLRENVDKLSTIQQAVDRMRYSITYFKPRAGVSNKPVYKIMSIDGENYNIDLNVLNEAKTKFGEDKAAIKEFIKSVSEKLQVEEI
jgi:hypothetical protein